jgi:hypothetical protein
MPITIALKPHENPRIDAMTAAKRLRWALEFIRRDLDALPSEMLEALGDDLLHATAPWVVGAPWWEGKTRPCTEMPAAEVRALQQDIRECVQSVTGNPIDIIDTMIIRPEPEPPHGWIIPEGPERLVRVRFGRGYERIVWLSRKMNERTQILRGVAQLLTQFTDRLETCPVCGTLFLRQYRKKYCGVKCSNKVRNKRRLDKKTHERQQGTNMKRRAVRVPRTPVVTTA